MVIIYDEPEVPQAAVHKKLPSQIEKGKGVDTSEIPEALSIVKKKPSSSTKYGVILGY